MKNLIAAVVTGIFLLAGLIIVSIPANRDVVPGIQNYFSLQTGIWQNARNADYPRDMVLQARAIDAEVQIVRGSDGIPRIIAQSMQDAIFALGYLSAYDRYFQTRLNARIAEGRVSEWLGSAYINTDRAFLDLGLNSTAWDQLERLSSDDYQVIANYASGVNTYINQHFSALKPVEFKLQNLVNNYWRPVDGLRVSQLIAYQLTYTDEAILHQKILNEIGEERFQQLYMRNYPGDVLLNGTLQSFRRETGQSLFTNGINYSPVIEHLNNQRNSRHRIPAGRSGQFTMQHIIAGSGRTERNQPIMAWDFHHQATIPSQFYEVHIHLPERSIYGITIPGFPGLLAAYNGHTAWSISRTPVDQTDFVQLEITPNHDEYRFDDEWVSFNTTSHQIPVAGRSDVRHISKKSRHGPVIFMDNYAVAMQWNALRNPINPANLWRLAESTTSSQIRDELNTWQWPLVMVSAVDRNGDMFSKLAGRYPVRNTAIGVHNGNNPATVWEEFIPSSELPIVNNPTNATLVYSSQNPSLLDNRMYLGYNWPKPWQKERINQLLQQRTLHNSENMSRILQDVYMDFSYLTSYLRAIEQDVTSSALRGIIQNVLAWDMEADVASDIPVLMDNFIRIFRSKAYESDTHIRMPSDRNWYYYLTQEPNHSFFDNPSTPLQENASDIILRSLQDAYEITLIEHGTQTNWNWGSINRMRVSHVSDASVFGVLNQSTWSRPGFNTSITQSMSRNATSGSVMRVVIDFGSSDSAVRVNHLGAINENPFSSFYAIRTADWLNGTYRARQFRPLEPGQVRSNIQFRTSGR